MPTTKPRYTLTDAGHLAELLDAASRRWPDVEDRKQLLLRLAEEGHQALVDGEIEANKRGQQERLRQAMKRIPSLVDRELLLEDQAWNNGG